MLLYAKADVLSEMLPSYRQIVKQLIFLHFLNKPDVWFLTFIRELAVRQIQGYHIKVSGLTLPQVPAGGEESELRPGNLPQEYHEAQTDQRLSTQGILQCTLTFNFVVALKRAAYFNSPSGHSREIVGSGRTEFIQIFFSIIGRITIPSHTESFTGFSEDSTKFPTWYYVLSQCSDVIIPPTQLALSLLCNLEERCFFKNCANLAKPSNFSETKVSIYIFSK